MYIEGKEFEGERALFKTRDAEIVGCRFHDGESPLKESARLKVRNTRFEWKYPLWYCRDVEVYGGVLNENARAGIWYTTNLTMRDTLIEAPKTFRRSKNLALENLNIPNAAETLWYCEDVSIKNVKVKGDYLALGCKNVTVEGLELDGNYAFDGVKDLTVKNSILHTKDAFWNCENVTVISSTICGEYFGWNSKNVTLIDCTVESLQGFCYMDGLVLKNCRTADTNLAFEYSTVDVDIDSIVSVINPVGGIIRAKKIGRLILDDKEVDSTKTTYIVEE